MQAKGPSKQAELFMGVYDIAEVTGTILENEMHLWQPTVELSTIRESAN